MRTLSSSLPARLPVSVLDVTDVAVASPLPAAVRVCVRVSSARAATRAGPPGTRDTRRAAHPPGGDVSSRGEERAVKEPAVSREGGAILDGAREA